MKNIFSILLFTGTTLLSTSAHSATLCGTGNPCQNFNRSIGGVTYCSNGTSCTTDWGGGKSGSGQVVSKYCANGKGDATGGSTCVPMSCNSGYVISSDTGLCVKPVCGPGYTGTATGANNAGCTACTNKPATATYTTNNSCDWKCVNTYYKSGNTCTQCKTSNVSGIYVNSALTSPQMGNTSDTSATSITNCYLPVGNTYYDQSGTFTISSACYYTN